MRTIELQQPDSEDDATSILRRVAAVRARLAAASELPLIPGWVSERTLAVGEEAHIVLVHRDGDRERRPFVGKLLRPMGPDGMPRDMDEQRARLLREIDPLRALGSVGCPGIPRVISFGLGSTETPAWYVMPYYAGGAMWIDDPRSGRWAEDYRGHVDRVLEIAEGVASTLAFMHDGPHTCVHGHVIAGNILLTERGTPVLGDFGYASLAGAAFRSRGADIPDECSWRPPELLRGTPNVPSPATDVFMLGGLIYEALSGGHHLPPASTWTEACVHDRWEHSLQRFTSDYRIAAVSALLGRMLVLDPSRRFSARQVVLACRSIRTGIVVR